MRAVNYSFQINGQWSKSIYEAVEDIEKNNPELFKELKLITSSISNSDKIESAKVIYRIIFKEDFNG